MEFATHTWIQAAAYSSAGIAIGFGAIGAAIGEGHTASCATLAVARNPGKAGEILKTMLVGQAIAESSSIFALVIAMLLLFSNFSAESYLTVATVFSAGLCMGLGAIGSGIGSGFSAGAACTGIARQPAYSSRVMTNMLIGSAVCQTPAIFSLVTSFILLFTNFSARPVSPTWAALLGAGLSTGLAAIGPGLGGGYVAEASCEGGARNPLTTPSVINVMLLGQAVTQTTAIYGFLVSCILMFKSFPATDSIAVPILLFSSGLCMGFGAIGPGIGVGVSGQGAVRWIARNPNAAADITRTMLIGMATAQSTGIYALVVALVMIFVM